MLITNILLMLAAANGPAGLDAEYQIDFRDGKFDNQQLQLIAPGMTRLVAPGPSGLTFTVPERIAINEVGFTTKCLVKGDFEITASYEILELAEPDAGYGVGPGIHIVTTSKSEHVATLSRRKRVKEGDVYVAYAAWWLDVRGRDREPKQQVRLFDTKVDSGKLRLVRSGKMLRYLVADEENEVFRLLHQIEFTDADLEQVRILIDRSGAQSTATVLWKDFTLRAEEISDLPRRSSGRGLLLWAMVGLVGVAAAFGTWYWQRAKCM